LLRYDYLYEFLILVAHAVHITYTQFWAALRYHRSVTSVFYLVLLLMPICGIVNI